MQTKSIYNWDFGWSHLNEEAQNLLADVLCILSCWATKIIITGIIITIIIRFISVTVSGISFAAFGVMKTMGEKIS